MKFPTMNEFAESVAERALDEFEYKGKTLRQWIDAIYAVNESFEWCTDCKEYDQEKHCCHRFSKIINQTVEEVRETTAIGEWVKVHGFATPGGDPVWRCSNCGKGIHVFGVEHHSYGADIADNQWVACPNCGAIMIGERDG